MKAVYVTEHGGIEKLTYGELPDPFPAGNEVLVRVRACGVNYVDLWVRRGLPFFGPARFPHIPGTELEKWWLWDPLSAPQPWAPEWC
jgi:NADPH:quinone reductase-like Zn-dependent oxidoreductase